MARLVAYDQFNVLNVDLYWYYYNTYSSLLSNNINFQYNGVTYPDRYYVNGYDGYQDLELYFFGSGFAQDSTGRVSSGVVNFVAEAEYNNGNLLWYAEGLSISAPALYNAATTVSNLDEYNLIVSAFSGDDTIILSPYADRMSGFAGNDTITGGLGQDWLEGGFGNDTFRDTRAGLNGDRLADFGFGDRIIITDATLANFTFQLSGSTVIYTGGTLTFGSAIHGGFVASAAPGGGVQLSLLNQFSDPAGVLVSNFAVGAGGWTSQDAYPRHVADMNGDGLGDIVGFGQAGVFISYRGSGGTFSAPFQVVNNFGQASGWVSDNQFHREVADLNGDGRADIIGFGVAGTWVSIAQANGSFTAAAFASGNFGANQGWTSQESFARTVGDIDGDGKADIIGFGAAGTWISLGNGDGTFSNPTLATPNFGVQQGWNSDNQFHRTVADINGDGFDDIIGFGSAGTWVALSKGDGTFGQAYLAAGSFGTAQGWSTQGAFPRQVADVNGDHRADIVGFGAAGTWVAYGQANGTFSAASQDVDAFSAAQGWTSDNTYHRELADLNNDGLFDIVGFGYAGVYVGYSQGHWVF